MVWQIVITAIGLVFLIEGLLPFSSPRLWRRFMQQVITQNDRMLHIMGLVSMLIGLLLVCIAHDLY